MSVEPNVLEVNDLVVEAATRHGKVTIVDGVSLSIAPGQTLGLVGESGSGKSMTALAILRLLGNGVRISSGQVSIQGTDLTALNPEQMRQIRGNQVGMIFQEPMTALDPAYTVGEQIAQGVRTHLGLPRKKAWARAVEMLDRVGIPSADKRAKDYPHHFSGGMRQRVVIAIALACEPALLLADEPTTAL
ncbi:MAG: ABC transporter ATP-binding protein, partial [Antricoccus sp.]